jgi:adenosine kinase
MFVRYADYVAVNDYEGQLLQERSGLTEARLAREVKAMIVTKGSEGSEIITAGETLRIPCVRPQREEDPTGCGDAYRAGLLYGIAHGWDWQRTGRLASLLGSIKIGHRGGQNHRFERASLSIQFERAFGEPLW